MTRPSIENEQQRMSQSPQKNDIWFRDVTEDSEACQTADRVSELRRDFERLGFRRVGFLGEYQTPGGILWVHEVLSSTNGDAFLTLTLVSDQPLTRRGPRTIPTAILQSALEDGSILITTTCREHRWRLNHPKAGLYLEDWVEATPEELWHRHQQRIGEVIAERNSLVLPHVSMSLCLWIQERCRKIGNYVALVAVCVCFIIAMEGWLLFWQLEHWLNAGILVPFGVFGLPLWLVSFFAMAAVVMWLIRNEVVRGWRVGQWFARQFPWPRRRRYDPMKMEED